MDKENALVVFQDKKIRRIWHKEEWFFSVVDVVEALTESPTPRQYWGKVKDREFLQLQLSPIWVQLKLPSSDGKLYDTDCANTESMFRIIQSIPSPKAEPFKLWLAKVGYERVQEIENPELAQGMQFAEKNNRERMEFVDKWAEYVKTHSDKDWSRQQNIVINSQLKSASITKEQFLHMKQEIV